MRAQVFQIAGCPWRCWYCYVPFPLLAGDVKRSEWRTAEELIDLYLNEPDRPAVIDLSGGSPDLAPEWIHWTMDVLEDRRLMHSVYLWSDDNLSTDLLLRPEWRRELRRLERYRGYGRVCCLKGFDSESFAFNSGADPSAFDNQLRVLEGYLGTELELYGYITLTAPRRGKDVRAAIRRLLDRLQAVDEGFIARIVPLRILTFSAMRHRVDSEREDALRAQEEHLGQWLAEMAARNSVPIWEGLRR